MTFTEIAFKYKLHDDQALQQALQDYNYHTQWVAPHSIESQLSLLTLRHHITIGALAKTLKQLAIQELETPRIPKRGHETKLQKMRKATK